MGPHQQADITPLLPPNTSSTLINDSSQRFNNGIIGPVSTANLSSCAFFNSSTSQLRNTNCSEPSNQMSTRLYVPSQSGISSVAFYPNHHLGDVVQPSVPPPAFVSNACNGGGCVQSSDIQAGISGHQAAYYTHLFAAAISNGVPTGASRMAVPLSPPDSSSFSGGSLITGSLPASDIYEPAALNQCGLSSQGLFKVGKLRVRCNSYYFAHCFHF